MNLDDVLQSYREYLGSLLIRDFNSVRQSKVTFTDFAARKITDSLLGPLLRFADADQLGTFGVERHLVAVNMEEKAGHIAETLPARQRSEQYCCSSSFSHPSSRFASLAAAD